ncbi:MAG: hypothetical protein WCL07_03985 [bacterium]
MHELIDQAIQLALIGNWDDAIVINLQILEDNPKDIATLNRLARAYSELGEKSKAKTTYEIVLKLDKYNAIANKNLRLLPHQKAYHQELIQEDFIETPGLTRSVSLVKIGSRETLATLCTKQKSLLTSKGRLLGVTTVDKLSIGCLPDDLSFKLTKLIEKNYEYACCIKSISENAVTIFIREIKRPNRASYSPTFSKALTYSKLKK